MRKVESVGVDTIPCAAMAEVLVTDSERTANLWSNTEPDVSRCYFGFPPLRPYLIQSAFGEAAALSHGNNRWWAEDLLVERYLLGRNVRTVASICCGFGAVEQHIVPALGTVRDCVALDLAPGAVNEARRRAQANGLGDVITYEVANLNEYAWPEQAFDLVIANGALHHLAQLDRVVSGLRTALKPNGLLYANEHVGARYQDFAPRQFELINAAAWLVPRELRQERPLRHNPITNPAARRLADIVLGNRDLGRSTPHPEWSTSKRSAARVARTCSLPPRRHFGPLVPPPKAQLLATDPSEGVSSDRIVPTIERHFSKVHIHPYGGAILAYALDPAFYSGFDPDDKRHCALLDLLCDVEHRFIAMGDLPMEHAIIVAE
jgi:SAM-dependent methyltransferase